MSPSPEPVSETPEPVEAGPTPARLVIAIGAGAAIATLGGFILGEYPFTGVTPYVAGALFALVVAEIILSISRRHDRVTAAASALCAVGGLAIAVWISTGEGIDPIPIGGWVALVVGLVVGLGRGGITGGDARARSSRPPS